MRMLDLFSGIGGFSLAGRWMGWETIAFCEIDKFCQYYLNQNFPNIPIHDNIKTTDFTIYRGLADIICGGFPCQPFSVAGKQRGTEDDRHLWPEMLRAIREVQPAWVVAENVPGITGIFQYESFNEVEGKEFDTKEEAEAYFNGVCEREGENVLHLALEGLKALGYKIQAFNIPASGVDADHQRERIWIVGYSDKYDARKKPGNTKEMCGFQEKECESEYSPIILGGTDCLTSNSQSEQLNRNINSRTGRDGFTDNNSDVANSNKFGQAGEKQQTARDKQCNCNASNTINKGLQGSKRGESFRYEGQTASISTPQCNRSEQWEENWYEAATRLCTLDDGFPGGLAKPKGWRVNALKACGNAIVPQVAYQIFEAIENYITYGPNDNHK